jgi:FG-GAP-like repeat
LVDLDGDGKTDLLSGSWPGEVYFFKRNGDNTFAAGQTVKDTRGQPINVGSASAAFAADWDGDGDPDLLVGTISGDVFLVPNEAKGKAPVFGEARKLEAAGEPLKVNGDAAPVAADWDGDGRLDLVVGAEDGSVVWHRNAGKPGEPKLEAARPLVGKSPVEWKGDNQREPGEWGLRVKPCVVDWDGDGRPDLLLGDRCGSFLARAEQTEQEKEDERRANDQLPGLRRRWAAAFDEFRRLRDAPADAPPAGAERQARLDELRQTLVRIKEETTRVQDVQTRYRPGYQSHGFVWLFLRKPAAAKGR